MNKTLEDEKGKHGLCPNVAESNFTVLLEMPEGLRHSVAYHPKIELFR